MPKVLQSGGIKFFFYSNEGSPVEPRHIHFRKSNNSGKFWLDPDVFLADSWGFSSKEINKIEKIAKINIDFFRRKWNEFFT